MKLIFGMQITSKLQQVRIKVFDGSDQTYPNTLINENTVDDYGDLLRIYYYLYFYCSL